MINKIVIACQTCGYLVKDIAKAYSEANYDVTIIASRVSQRIIKDSLHNNVGYRSVITYNRSSAIKRILTWGVCTIQMFLKIGFRYREWNVLYVSNPPLAPLLPLILRNKFSVLIWDIYPDVLVNQNVINNNNLIARLWRKANRSVYNNAEHIYTISDGMKKCLSQYVDESKIKVVPLWPDGMMRRIDKSENLFIKEQKLEGKFVVMYSGNLGNTHRMDVLLDVAKLIHDEDFVFLLIGEGAKKRIIEERIGKEKIRNVRLLPFQPLEMLPYSLSAADIAVVTLDTNSSQMSVPSKTFNLMAVGVPLLCIASPDSELGNLVRKYEVGAIYPPESAVEMAEFVIHLKTEEQVKNRYRTNAMVAAQYFTSKNAKMFVDTI